MALSYHTIILSFSMISQVEAPHPHKLHHPFLCPMIFLGFLQKKVFPHQIHRIQVAVISHRFHQSPTLPEIRIFVKWTGTPHLKWERTLPPKFNKDTKNDTLENASPASKYSYFEYMSNFGGAYHPPHLCHNSIITSKGDISSYGSISTYQTKKY